MVKGRMSLPAHLARGPEPVEKREILLPAVATQGWTGFAAEEGTAAQLEFEELGRQFARGDGVDAQVCDPNDALLLDVLWKRRCMRCDNCCEGRWMKCSGGTGC